MLLSCELDRDILFYFIRTLKYLYPIGLFKIEWEGDAVVALNSKTYYCYSSSDKDKFSAKGINRKTNDVTFEMYKDVLFTGASQGFINRGFIMRDGSMRTYNTIKTGLSYFYGKREVLDNGMSTIPLAL